MSEEKYTPGPWDYHEGDDYVVVMSEEQNTDNALARVDTVANAKLIATTPDLLKELQRAANMLSDVAGDLEDGVNGLRGKYVMALIQARDNALDVIRKATSQIKVEG